MGAGLALPQEIAYIAERMPNKLARSFYEQDTVKVARNLLGQRLCRRLPDGQILAATIIETEAYLGIEDPACHSFASRRTPRVEVMYGPAGFSYVYFIYGVHFCFNVVTQSAGVPEAVLIRALDHERANGPGKLCTAFGIDRRHNAVDLVTSSELWIGAGERCLADSEILEGPRVGLGDRYDAVHWPLRFGYAGKAGLSKMPFTRPGDNL